MRPIGTNLSRDVLTSLFFYGHPRYRDIYEAEEIQKTLAVELELYWSRVNEVLNQMNVPTSTWSISAYERDVSVAVDPSKPLAERRSVVLSKYRGAGTTTKDFIEEVASSYAGGEVAVNDIPSESRVEISFISTLGVPPNISDFEKTLREILPAHYDYTLIYTFVTYGQTQVAYADYAALTASGLTYEELLTGGE